MSLRAAVCLLGVSVVVGTIYGIPSSASCVGHRIFSLQKFVLPENISVSNKARKIQYTVLTQGVSARL